LRPRRSSFGFLREAFATSRFRCRRRPRRRLEIISSTDHITMCAGADRGPAHCVPLAARAENMSRISHFNSPFLLGFDELERLLDRATKASGDGYPPYNIERLPRDGETAGDSLLITLAVAGFGPDELDVTVEENQLIIRGKQRDDGERAYLHRGIAARQFQRAFVLADGMEVAGADLANGLLSIRLVRPEPERIVRKIDIRVSED
jgi:HSP20 family molecular chaperone IbpA